MDCTIDCQLGLFDGGCVFFSPEQNEKTTTRCSFVESTSRSKGSGDREDPQTVCERPVEDCGKSSLAHCNKLDGKHFPFDKMAMGDKRVKSFRQTNVIP